PTAGPKGSWTPVHPPTGWGRIGDAASVVLPYLFDAQGVLQATSGILPNGTFMLSNCCGFPPRAALLNEQAALLEETGELTWTVLTSTSGYEKKYDSNNEEGWTLLPDGNVLTV